MFTDKSIPFRFILGGASTAALYALIIIVSAEVLKLPPSVAAGISYVIAVIYNYVFHYYLTYRTDRPHRSSAPRYILLVAALFLANVGATALIPNYFDIGYGIVQVALGLLFATATFFGQLLWSFARTTPRS
ncbi:GtrA family protein [Caenispirillum salinarum]|uniref:GtrA family protein n=1 Tax=Caenispirillum salinarum TaxID=859058 RepID=UPI00384D852B